MTDETDKAVAFIGGTFLTVGFALAVGTVAVWLGVGTIGSAGITFCVLGIALLATSGWGNDN